MCPIWTFDHFDYSCPKRQWNEEGNWKILSIWGNIGDICHLPERWTFGHLERLRPLRPAAGGRWTFGQGDTSTVVDSSQVRPRRRKCEKRNWEIRVYCIWIQFVTELPHNIGEINEITGTDKLKIQSFDNELLIKLKIRVFQNSRYYLRWNPAHLANWRREPKVKL